MIHPDTELKYVGEPIGYGVFATAFIPTGTIVYAKDCLETIVTPDRYLSQHGVIREMIDKYSYIDELGSRIVSWDHAKYVNHCCNCNTMSTGYGFEIAIQDIENGEQITDEYGLFNIEEEMELNCNSRHCRGRVSGEDLDTYYYEWDEKVLSALSNLQSVSQPLFGLVDQITREDLEAFYKNARNYRSVLSLKYTKHLKCDSKHNPSVHEAE